MGTIHSKEIAMWKFVGTTAKATVALFGMGAGLAITVGSILGGLGALFGDKDDED